MQDTSQLIDTQGTVADINQFSKSYTDLYDLEQLEERNLRYGFKAANYHFLIPKNLASEVIPMNQICVLPNTDSNILGVINLRGNLVPVFDLERVISGKDTDSRYTYLFIIGSSDDIAAVPINELPASIDLEHLQFDIQSSQKLPEHLTDFTQNICKENDNYWYEMNFIQWFSSISKSYHD